MQHIVLIINDVRSAHNVGSLLRTADGLGVDKVYLSGITPYPEAPDDQRLPHIRLKVGYQIAKTALGAEESVNWQYRSDISDLLAELKSQAFEVIALEQAEGSVKLPDYKPASKKVALLVGNEVTGLGSNVLEQCSTLVEIPMDGKKESYNVAVAAAMALYHLRFIAYQ